jgi:endonuclease/exonuclease/phosphatase family metal-dependent hydrolase
MTEIVTWNIQCGLGVDGRVDLARIAGVIRAMADADVVCLQEVSRFMADMDGSAGADQVAQLGELFPGYTPLFGAAVDRAGDAAGRRRRFGNLVLSRLPVLQVFRHLLPQPADPAVKHMPRQATEVVVEAAGGPLRVLTTHLEFHSEPQRQTQAQRLRDLQAEVAANARAPGALPPDGPYAAHPRPAGCMICGDFNIEPDDGVYRRMVAPFADDTPGFEDAWRRRHGARPHDPTCGIFDHRQWPQGGHCRDYFFVTPDIAGRIEDVSVDTATDASDHQPVRLLLDG